MQRVRQRGCSCYVAMALSLRGTAYECRMAVMASKSPECMKPTSRLWTGTNTSDAQYNPISQTCDMYGSGHSRLLVHTPRWQAKCKVFGSELIDMPLKNSFKQSLHDSRLFHNAHIRVLSGRELGILNTPCMRIIRRIMGLLRQDASALSDLEVRRRGNYPSVDCIVLKGRLCYLARLVNSSCKPLLALLSTRDGENLPRLPWSRQIRGDLEQAYNIAPAFRKMLPHPGDHAKVWMDFISNNPNDWCEVVRSVRFVESVHDRETVPVEGPSIAAAFACT